MTARNLMPCKWCGIMTTITETQCCDSCYELEYRIEHNPKLAIAMLQRKYNIVVLDKKNFEAVMLKEVFAPNP